MKLLEPTLLTLSTGEEISFKLTVKRLNAIEKHLGMPVSQIAASMGNKLSMQMVQAILERACESEEQAKMLKADYDNLSFKEVLGVLVDVFNESMPDPPDKKDGESGNE